MTFTSTHWGAYRPVVSNGRLAGMEPAPWDTDTSPSEYRRNLGLAT